ncbi:uncharacterized protein LOC143912191 [Arctopsyche grandis]|uniref:uncharacterized protein LOC143912191 n=1 Tax=Arctopsyche grandis TaxID=121162 RepID=UPI00406D89F1
MSIICTICGVSAAHRSYVATHKLQGDVKRKISWVLTPKIDICFNKLNNVCAICLQKVDNIIMNIRDMRKQCVLTILLLKEYYKNSSDSSWVEFQQLHPTNSLTKTEDIKRTLDELECVISDDVKSPEFDVDKDKNSNIDGKVTDVITPLRSKLFSSVVEDDCTDEEWLSDVESEVHIETTKFPQTDVNITISEDDCIKVKDVCNIRVNRRGYIYVTKSQEHVEERNDGVFTCLLCNKNFKYRHKAELHVRSDHIQEKPFKCNECTKTFAASHYLRRHISGVHEKKKFICEKCQRAFSRRYELTTHEKSHNNQPHISCLYSTCDKKFYAKFLMKKHFLNSHADKMLICDECGKAFRLKYRLMKHIKSHHKSKCK